jgi:hypothetical protein
MPVDSGLVNVGTKVKNYLGWAWETWLLSLVILPLRLITFHPVLRFIIAWTLIIGVLFFLVLGVTLGIGHLIAYLWRLK